MISLLLLLLVCWIAAGVLVAAVFGALIRGFSAPLAVVPLRESEARAAP